MKDRKYDKRHVRSKNHSGCLETSCHVRGPMRNKMATLGVIPSRSDIDPLADPVLDQTMLQTVSLIESDIPRAFLKPSILKGSKLTVGSLVGPGTGSAEGSLTEWEGMTLSSESFLPTRSVVYRTSDLSCKGSIISYDDMHVYA